MTLVPRVAGAVKHEELVKLAEKAFGGVKASKGSAHFFWLRPCSKAGPPRVYSTKPYFCGAQDVF